MKSTKNVLILLVLLACIGFGVLRYFTAESPVMVINGEQIRQEEYEFYLDHYAWEMEGKDEKQFIAEKKVEQQLAVKMGAAESFEFEKLKKRMIEKNEENQEKRKNGDPVYGLLAYDFPQFYDYEYNNAVLRLKEKLYKNELKATEEEKESFYEEHKMQLFKKTPEGTYYLFSGSASDEVKKMLLEILEKNNADETLEMLKTDSQHLLDVEKLEINEESLRTLEKTQHQIVEELFLLEEQEWSGLIESDYQYRILYCEIKKEGEVMEFKEVEDTIQSRVGDIKYEEYLKEQTKDAEIKMNRN